MSKCESCGGRVEWVAECRCASLGLGHDWQGRKCIDCGKKPTDPDIGEQK